MIASSATIGKIYYDSADISVTASSATVYEIYYESVDIM